VIFAEALHFSCFLAPVAARFVLVLALRFSAAIFLCSFPSSNFRRFVAVLYRKKVIGEKRGLFATKQSVNERRATSKKQN